MVVWGCVCVCGRLYVYSSTLLLLYTQIFPNNNFNLQLSMCWRVSVCAGDRENQQFVVAVVFVAFVVVRV